MPGAAGSATLRPRKTKRPSRMRLEYGEKGASAVEVGKGDFFHIPPRLVHRDVNPDKEQELVVVNILVGKGEPVINVKRPKRA